MTVRFGSLTIVFDDVIVFSPQRLRGTCIESRAYTYILNC